jgi:RNA polymerase sigma-70 factor (ECF subfamily)
MDENSREKAVRRWGDTVWRLALSYTGSRQDAEDVFQEVFLRYFRHEGKFATDEHRKAWLIRCTINRSKSLLASPWRKRTVSLEAAAGLGVSPENREVYDAVLALPPKFKAAIHLYYYEGLSVGEIARCLSCAEGTVKSRLSRGRDMLREALKEDIEL